MSNAYEKPPNTIKLSEKYPFHLTSNKDRLLGQRGQTSGMREEINFGHRAPITRANFTGKT